VATWIANIYFAVAALCLLRRGGGSLPTGHRWRFLLRVGVSHQNQPGPWDRTCQSREAALRRYVTAVR